MFKPLIAAVAAAPLFAGAAFAGPYVNVETNAGWTGSDYDGSVTDIHIGYEGALGENTGYYVQAGPALYAPDGDEVDTRFSGKGGVTVAATENVGVYGEISFLTGEDSDDDNGYGGKIGLKYTF